MIAKYMADLSNVAGDAKLFYLDEPLDGAGYVAVAVINWPRWRLVETQVFPATEHGAIVADANNTLGLVIKIPPVNGVAPDHDAALASLGYAADYTPWPVPEPTFKAIVAVTAFTVADPQGNVLTVVAAERVALPIPVAQNLIAQGVAVDDTVADFQGDAVARHGLLFGGGQRCRQGRRLVEQPELHGGVPGRLARRAVVGLALEDLQLLAKDCRPVAVVRCAGSGGRDRGGEQQEGWQEAQGRHRAGL